jgi:hypothetical protein
MAGSTEGSVDLETVGSGGESFNYLVRHHRQVPYLHFGAPLGRGLDGRAVLSRTERIPDFVVHG